MEAETDFEAVLEIDGEAAPESPQDESPEAKGEESQPPFQPRVSWSAKTRKSVKPKESSSKDFNVQEEAETDESHKGVFRSIANIWSKALRWRRLASVTPDTSQQSDSRFLDPEKSSSSQRDDSIAMQTIDVTEANKGASGIFRTSRYTNPAYVPRYSDSEDQPTQDGSETQKNYRAYDSGIYSVNSAGNPVPITIEESGPADDSSSGKNC